MLHASAMDAVPIRCVVWFVFVGGERGGDGTEAREEQITDDAGRLIQYWLSGRRGEMQSWDGATRALKLLSLDQTNPRTPRPRFGSRTGKTWTHQYLRVPRVPHDRVHAGRPQPSFPPAALELASEPARGEKVHLARPREPEVGREREERCGDAEANPLGGPRSPPPHRIVSSLYSGLAPFATSATTSEAWNASVKTRPSRRHSAASGCIDSQHGRT